MNKMEWTCLVAVALVTGAAAVGWSGKISLSVLVGGVIGCANLRLWRRIVQGLIIRRRAAVAGLVGRFFLKILLLVGFVLVVLRSSFAPWGVVAGFGSVLVGMVWAAWFEGEAKHAWNTDSDGSSGPVNG